MTERPVSEHPPEAGLNRRDLFQTVAAGAAVSGAIASAALAQEQKSTEQGDPGGGVGRGLCARPDPLG